MKLGVDSYSTRNSGLDAAGVLELAGDLGLHGVLFELSPFSSFRDADLEQIRQTAQRRGLYVEMGMGSIFHWHPMAAKGRELLAKAGCNVNVSDAQIVITISKSPRSWARLGCGAWAATFSSGTKATT